ncbi:MAG: septum formation initiator family protein [Luteolibacter sp.]|nr:septum formation initiator family protein [Luteolibacter sp.]
MARKRMEAAKLTRLEARTRVIRGAGRLLFIVFGVALGFVVVATAVPQRRELEKLESRLKLAEDREREVNAERDHRSTELRALREDPAYLEVHARDRLDYCGEGERILRLRRKP